VTPIASMNHQVYEPGRYNYHGGPPQRIAGGGFHSHERHLAHGGEKYSENMYHPGYPPQDPLQLFSYNGMEPPSHGTPGNVGKKSKATEHKVPFNKSTKKKEGTSKKGVRLVEPGEVYVSPKSHTANQQYLPAHPQTMRYGLHAPLLNFTRHAMAGSMPQVEATSPMASFPKKMASSWMPVAQAMVGPQGMFSPQTVATPPVGYRYNNNDQNYDQYYGGNNVGYGSGNHMTANGQMVGNHDSGLTRGHINSAPFHDNRRDEHINTENNNRYHQPFQSHTQQQPHQSSDTSRSANLPRSGAWMVEDLKGPPEAIPNNVQPLPTLTSSPPWLNFTFISETAIVGSLVSMAWLLWSNL